MRLRFLVWAADRTALRGEDWAKGKGEEGYLGARVT